MGKVIILEGPDGCGKTTLARKLESNGWAYRHEGPPAKDINLIDHYLRILYDSLESNENVVHDRLHLGERVYGKIARGNDRLGSEGLKLFERLHQSKAITQIICLTDFPTAKENYKLKMKDKEDYLKSEEMWIKVYDSYKRYIGSSLHIEKDWRKFDYKQDEVSDVLELSNIYSREPLPSGAIGNKGAKYLFIGDRANHDYIDIPFFATTGSSGYLNSAITLAHIEEKDVVLYNANDCFGKEHSNYIEVIDSLLNIDSVFVMGTEARNFVRDNFTSKLNGLRFHYLPHPSYLKRFRGNNPVVMAEMIRGAIDGIIS